MIAVVRVKGNARVKKDIEDTLQMIRLKTVNNCIIIPEDNTYKGMINKTKDYITWGEIKPDTFKKMLLKWGRIEGNKKVTDDYLKQKNTSTDGFVNAFFEGKASLKDIGVKIPFKLHPPRKGYEAVKKPFTAKGTLGYRGEKINELLERMI